MKFFGKDWKEYFLPVKWEILGMLAVVAFQYEGMLRFLGYDPMVARVTQWVWMLLVALATFKLMAKHGFELKNVIVSGIIFSIIIHGLKAFVFRAFFWQYDLPASEIPSQLVGKFLYGSALVMAVSFVVWLILFLKQKGWLEK